MPNTVFVLIEISGEDEYTHAIYRTKRGALKSLLALKRKCVTENLNAYRLYGKGWLSPDYYRKTWFATKLIVDEYEIFE